MVEVNNRSRGRSRRSNQQGEYRMVNWFEGDRELPMIVDYIGWMLQVETRPTSRANRMVEDKADKSARLIIMFRIKLNIVQRVNTPFENP